VPPALLEGVKRSGEETAVVGGDASMRDVPIVATETLTPEKVHTSTEVVGSGALEEKSILEKSECTLKPVAVGCYGENSGSADHHENGG